MGMYFVYLVGKIYGDTGGNSASELVAIALAHRDERRILSRGGLEISKNFFFQIRIHIVLINY